MTAVTELAIMRCLACESTSQRTLHVRGGMLVHQCRACGQVFVDPQPTDDALSAIYTADYFLDANQSEGSDVKRQTARLYLDLLTNYVGAHRGKLLDIGCGNGEFLIEASRQGFDGTGVEVSEHAARNANALLGRNAVTCSTIENAGLPDHEFDVVVCADVIEHTRDPIDLLAHVHRILKPGGVLLIVTPALDSWPARFLKHSWYEFKTEHLHYFTRSTLGNVLQRTGFQSVEVSPGRKALTLEYIHQHFRRFPVRGWSAVARLLRAILPTRARNALISVRTSSVIALARAGVKRSRPLVSVIVPVYNEGKTVRTLLEALIAKELTGADKEIIVVDGNSDDGSREELLRFNNTPSVRLVLQDRPRGKGFAIRQALEHATGDIVLIQDADLEYSLDDYDNVLEPVRTYRRAFVLGSRHAGKNRIRDFTDQLFLGLVFNVGHLLLTGLFNALYVQALKDPWTMYKVFRRDCLNGLNLECDRFDFDVELVAKLVRKGYEPIEIPVRYKSRSFAEGKKIRILSDPWTWLWACLKYRIVSPYKQQRSL